MRTKLTQIIELRSASTPMKIYRLFYIRKKMTQHDFDRLSLFNHIFTFVMLDIFWKACLFAAVQLMKEFI